MTTFDVFKRAERVETISAAIYAALARQFAGDETTRALFARLEQEELRHANRVRLLAARYQHDKRLLENVSGVPEIEACLVVAESALAEVSAGQWGSDLASVKARLAVLEEQLARCHAQAIAQDGNAAVRDLFRQLALQDGAHAALLGTK